MPLWALIVMGWGAVCLFVVFPIGLFLGMVSAHYRTPEEYEAEQYPSRSEAIR